MKNRLLFSGLVIVVMFSTNMVRAATDGSLGLTSTGTTDITVTKGDLAQISKMGDIDLGVWAAGAVSGTQAICVYSTTGAYNVTATSLNTSGTDFRLFDGLLNFLDYSVEWEDNTPGFIALTHGVVLGSQAGDNTNMDCGGAAATNATVRVSITGIAMTLALLGIYTDTLTLSIAPE